MHSEHIQLEKHAETSEQRLEKMEENIRKAMEGNTQAVKHFIQTTIAQQMSSVLMAAITLIDATGQKHPVLMNMAGSLEVSPYKIWKIFPGY